MGGKRQFNTLLFDDDSYDSTEKRCRNPKVQLFLPTETHPLWRKVEFFSVDSSYLLLTFVINF